MEPQEQGAEGIDPRLPRAAIEVRYHKDSPLIFGWAVCLVGAREIACFSGTVIGDSHEQARMEAQQAARKAAERVLGAALDEALDRRDQRQQEASNLAGLNAWQAAKALQACLRPAVDSDPAGRKGNKQPAAPQRPSQAPQNQLPAAAAEVLLARTQDASEKQPETNVETAAEEATTGGGPTQEEPSQGSSQKGQATEGSSAASIPVRRTEFSGRTPFRGTREQGRDRARQKDGTDPNHLHTPARSPDHRSEGSAGGSPEEGGLTCKRSPQIGAELEIAAGKVKVRTVLRPTWKSTRLGLRQALERQGEVHGQLAEEERRAAESALRSAWEGAVA